MPDPDTASSPAPQEPQDRIAAALERIAESLEVLARAAVERATAGDDDETGEAAEPPDELDDALAAAAPPLPPALELSRLSDLS